MKPHPKVTAGALAGSLTIIIVWGLQSAGVDVPPEVASSFTTIITFAAAYLKSP